MILSKKVTPLYFVALCGMFFLLNGCAQYRDLLPGTIKPITGEALTTPLQKAKAMRARKTESPVVEQENVTLLPLDDPAPPPEYIVGPNDVLFINVSGKAEFSSLASSGSSSNLGRVQPPPAAALTAAATSSSPTWGRSTSAG